MSVVRLENVFEDRTKEKEKERLEKLEKRRAKERDEHLRESVAKGKQSAAVPSLKSTLVEQHKAHIPQETRPDSLAVPRTKDDKISSSSRDVASSETVRSESSPSLPIACPFLDFLRPTIVDVYDEAGEPAWWSEFSESLKPHGLGARKRFVSM